MTAAADRGASSPACPQLASGVAPDGTSLGRVTDATATSAAGRGPAGQRPAGPMAPAYRLVTLCLVALVSIIAFEAMAISTAMPSSWVVSMAETFSWRWVFLVVVAPVVVTMAVVAGRREQMRDDADRERSATAPAEQRRLVGLGLVVAVAAGAMQWGAASLVPVRALPLVATVVGLLGVAVASPRLLPRGTLRMARGLPSVMLSRFLLTAAFNGAMTFVPLMLILSRGLGATVAGAMLTVGAVGWSAGSWVQGQQRFSGRRSWLVSVGGASLSVGVAGLAAIAGLGLPSLLVGVSAALCGTGMGLAMSSTSVLSLALSPVAEHGRTSSSLQLADVLGSVMGIAAAGSVFAALHNGVRSDIPTFVLMWLVLAAVAALVVPGGQRTRT